MIFETERLIIRNYINEDRPVFAAIACNPAARVFHLSALTRAESDAFIDVQIATIDGAGYGFAVVERKADGAVMGDVGLRAVPDHYLFSKDFDFEIGWQFDPAYFGNGYASEAAEGWLDRGFGALGIAEIVSYTAALKTPSIKVMERIGMTRDPARDYDHRNTPEGHPLRPQIVFSVVGPG
ncbi:MAG: GNAT family N-acetyltransferase [Alphaproteobacteria bacterium]|jgi:RimJ/RimL family protein N-acetyltransferase